MKILVVEDNLVDLKLLTSICTSAGYQVVQATTGDLASVELSKSLFPVVITDWLMPGELDGIGLIKKIRKEIKPNPVIIMQTNVGTPESKKHALMSGADAYLEKPLGKTQILKTISDCLKIRDSQPGLFSKYTRDTKSYQLKAPFLGIGIAASTGGPETLTRFFEQLPLMKNVAFFLVQHGPEWLMPKFQKSLSKSCHYPVIIPENNMHINEGAVYLAPGGYHMKIASQDLKFLLEKSEPVNYVIPAADPLFESLAESFRQKAIGIVMTGMGKDGAFGLRKIIDYGGHGLIENPETAILNGMPRSAQLICNISESFDIPNLTKNLVHLIDKLVSK